MFEWIDFVACAVLCVSDLVFPGRTRLAPKSRRASATPVRQSLAAASASWLEINFAHPPRLLGSVTPRSNFDFLGDHSVHTFWAWQCYQDVLNFLQRDPDTADS